MNISAWGSERLIATAWCQAEDRQASFVQLCSFSSPAAPPLALSWAHVQLPVHPNTASPYLFIHIALLLMQKAAYVIACYSSVNCLWSSTDALESCLTLSHAIPVLLLHLSHHLQHLLVLCTTLSLCLSPAVSLPPVLHISSSKCRPLAFISTLPSNSYLTNTVLDVHSSSAEQTWVYHLWKYLYKG